MKHSENSVSRTGWRPLCYLILATMFVTASGCNGCSCSKGGSAKPALPNPGTAQFATASLSVSEYAGSVTVTVNRVGGTVGAVAVQVAFSGTATLGMDYTVPGGTSPVTLNWADTVFTPQTITITITDDLLAEPAETIILTLLNPTNGLVLGAPITITITLVEAWTKFPNPVLSPVPATFNASGVLSPCVVKRGPADYVMWYNGYDTTDNFGIATSTDGVTWAQGPSVFTVGAAGAFDDTELWMPWVVYEPASPPAYKMWYTGRHVVGTTIDEFKIGYAESPDGVTWNRQPAVNPTGNPVLSPTAAAWDSAWVYFASVINDAGTYKMWYTGNNSPTAGVEQIGYATSTNGIAWTKGVTNPIFSPTGTGFERTSVFAPCVIKDGTNYRMYYSGFNNTAPGTTDIGYARSTDGTTWNRYAGNPIIARGAAGAWDEVSVAFCCAIRDGNVFKLWYTGVSGGVTPLSQIGYATNP